MHDAPDVDANGVISPDSLLAWLQAKGVSATLLRPGVPMPTVPLAAEAIGVEPSRILKSILFQEKDGAVVLAIAAGMDRIEKAAVARAAGLSSVRLAPSAVVLERCGFPAGGVAPVGHRTAVPVLLDSAAARLDVAYGGGGAEDVLLAIRPKDIIAITGAKVCPIVVCS